MDYSALAKQHGAIQQQSAPVSTNQDWMGGLSPKDQAELQMKTHGEARKRIADLDSEISRAGGTVRDLERFGVLNRKSATGGLWNSVLPSVGFLHSDEAAEMNKLQSLLGPGQREVGSGSSTDKDVNLYLAGLPSTSDTGAVNKNVRMEFMKRYKYATDKRQEMEGYLNQNGNLVGFDTAWQAKRSAMDAAQQKRPSGGPQDSAAVTWARSSPNDPRAAQILRLNGQ